MFNKKTIHQILPSQKGKPNPKQRKPLHFNKGYMPKSALKAQRSLVLSGEYNPFCNGFTILEMMVVLLVVAVLLMITLPNIQQKEQVIRAKGCEALVEVVNSQIMLYEIDHDETPTDVSQLIQEGYLKESQAKCPNGDPISIHNGEAAH